MLRSANATVCSCKRERLKKWRRIAVNSLASFVLAASYLREGTGEFKRMICVLHGFSVIVTMVKELHDEGNLLLGFSIGKF